MLKSNYWHNKFFLCSKSSQSPYILPQFHNIFQTVWFLHNHWGSCHYNFENKGFRSRYKTQFCCDIRRSRPELIAGLIYKCYLKFDSKHCRKPSWLMMLACKLYFRAYIRLGKHYCSSFDIFRRSFHPHRYLGFDTQPILLYKRIFQNKYYHRGKNALALLRSCKMFEYNLLCCIFLDY